MKTIKTFLLCLFILPIAAQNAKPFQGKIIYKVSAKGHDYQETKYYKNKMVKSVGDTTWRNSIIFYNLAEMWWVRFSKLPKDYVAYQDQIPGKLEKVNYLEEFKDIAGYKCQHVTFLIEFPATQIKFNAWVTKEIVADFPGCPLDFTMLEYEEKVSGSFSKFSTSTAVSVVPGDLPDQVFEIKFSDGASISDRRSVNPATGGVNENAPVEFDDFQNIVRGSKSVGKYTVEQVGEKAAKYNIYNLENKLVAIVRIKTIALDPVNVDLEIWDANDEKSLQSFNIEYITNYKRRISPALKWLAKNNYY